LLQNKMLCPYKYNELNKLMFSKINRKQIQFQKNEIYLRYLW